MSENTMPVSEIPIKITLNADEAMAALARLIEQADILKTKLADLASLGYVISNYDSVTNSRTAGKLWITGKETNFGDVESVWEFIGIYDSQEKAGAACRHSNYFVAPAILNRTLPDETVQWDSLYYPLIENDKQTTGEEG